jgi:hypothetical protein
MHRPRITVAILTAAVAALSATPAAAERSCGREVVQRSAVRVTITRGRVTCAVARGVIKRWLSLGSYPPTPGTAIEHGGPNAGLGGKTWTMPNGWTCLVATRGGACALRGSGALRFRNPRDEIRYLFA